MKNNNHDAGFTDGSLPNEILRDLSAFHVTPQVRAVVAAASTHVRMTSKLRDTYVSLAPRSGGFVASFVHKARLTVAMPPARAEALRGQHGWKVRRKNCVTSYLQIPSDGLVSEAQRSVARDLLVEAIKWRTP
jgi:hypothetical protein